MQQSIVPPPLPLLYSFSVPAHAFMTQPATPRWPAAAEACLQRVLSLLSRLQARTLWPRPAPSGVADSGSGTAQILAVNKELANAAPTQRRTTAKWKVPALPPRLFFVCFLTFFGFFYFWVQSGLRNYTKLAPHAL